MQTELSIGMVIRAEVFHCWLKKPSTKDQVTIRHLPPPIVRNPDVPTPAL